MKNQFIKIVTKYGKMVWLNVSHIVAVYEGHNQPDCFVILTNSNDGDGEGQVYIVEGSLELFLETLDVELKYFT